MAEYQNEAPNIQLNGFNMDENPKVPNIDKVMEMFEKMDGISEEEKNSIRQNLLQQAANGDIFKQIAGHGRSNNEYIAFLAMIGIIIIVFAFFGYKLYKSLVEKQRKREEKLKAKQSKKKK